MWLLCLAFARSTAVTPEVAAAHWPNPTLIIDLVRLVYVLCTRFVSRRL